MTEQQEKIIRALRSDQARITSGAITRTEKQVIEEIHNNLFREGVNKNCGTCWIKALYRITIELNIETDFLNQKPTSMPSSSNFSLKPGKILWLGQDGVTDKNLTDNKAIALIKRVPATKRLDWLKKTFEKYPENWEQMLGGISLPALTPEVIDPTKENVVGEKEPATSDKVVDLDSMTRNELLEEAKRRNLPVAEYSKKNKTALVIYLKEKSQ